MATPATTTSVQQIDLATIIHQIGEGEILDLMVEEGLPFHSPIMQIVRFRDLRSDLIPMDLEYVRDSPLLKGLMGILAEIGSGRVRRITIEAYLPVRAEYNLTYDWRIGRSIPEPYVTEPTNQP